MHVFEGRCFWKSIFILIETVDFIIVLVIVNLVVVWLIKKVILFIVFIYHVKVVLRVLVCVRIFRGWDACEVFIYDRVSFVKGVSLVTSLSRTRNRLGSGLLLWRCLHLRRLFLAGEVKALLFHVIFIVIFLIENNVVLSFWLSLLWLSLPRLSLRRLSF